MKIIASGVKELLDNPIRCLASILSSVTLMSGYVAYYSSTHIQQYVVVTSTLFRPNRGDGGYVLTVELSPLEKGSVKSINGTISVDGSESGFSIAPALPGGLTVDLTRPTKTGNYSKIVICMKIESRLGIASDEIATLDTFSGPALPSFKYSVHATDCPLSGFSG